MVYNYHYETAAARTKDVCNFYGGILLPPLNHSVSVYYTLNTWFKHISIRKYLQIQG